MNLCGGIDLLSNNNVLTSIDKQDRVVYDERLRSDLQLIVHAQG